MIGTRTYMSLSSTERPEVITPMTHEEFRKFCVGFHPDCRDISSGEAQNVTRELLLEACLRIAKLEGSNKALRTIIEINNECRQERLAVHSDTLSDPEAEELAENGVYPREATA